MPFKWKSRLVEGKYIPFRLDWIVQETLTWKMAASFEFKGAYYAGGPVS